MDGQNFDEERSCRTILVKSLPPSTNKQDLMIHFQSGKNGGGDIEDLELFDDGSAVIIFVKEKVAKSVQRQKQTFGGVLLTVGHYDLQHEKKENLQVFSNVSAMIDPTKLGLTLQQTQALLKKIQDETKVDLAKPPGKKDVFILTGSFHQIQESRDLLQNYVTKGNSCDGNYSIKRGETTIVPNDIPKGMVNGKECQMNGIEELPSMKDEAKGPSINVNGIAASNPKTSKELTISKKEGSSYNPNLEYSKKETTVSHAETKYLNSSVKCPTQSGKKISEGKQGSLNNSTPNKDAGKWPNGENTLPSVEKEKSENKYSPPLKKESSHSSEEEAVDCTQKIEISSKGWNVFVKMCEKELESVMAIFSVQIEPEDNKSVVIIKPSADQCNKEKLKMAREELKGLYEEASSKMTLVRFVLADPENQEHIRLLRKTVVEVKKEFPVFLERAEDRQSWEIFGESGQVEKGLKLLEENVKLKRKEQNVDDKTMEEADSEDESYDVQSSDTDADDDVDQDYDGIGNEKLEHHLGNVKVSVYRGDITEEECDAIVNAANERLEHGAGVAWAIASKGGSSIREDCRRIVNSKGKLKVGDAAISHSGNLRCKMIIHAVGPNWKYDKGEKGKALLKEACKASLTQAKKYSVKSIAFPAISSGIFGMPKRICAQVMFDAAEEYSKSVTSSGVFGLWDIRFVNNDLKTVNAFRSEFKSRYGSGKLIPESNGEVMVSSIHSACQLGNEPMLKNKKPFKIAPTWKVEPKQSEEKTSHKSHSNTQTNGKSLFPRCGKLVAKEFSQPLDNDTENSKHQNQPKKDRGFHQQFIEEEPHNHSKSGNHGIFKSLSFSGGARPKESQFSKDKRYGEHLRASSSSTKTKDDASNCSICRDKMKQPKTLPRCKHTFCKTCLEAAIKQSPKCPYCREPLEDRQGSPTDGQATNGYHYDDAYIGWNSYDDATTLCLLCAKPPMQPKTLSCRHTFCKPCIDRALMEYPTCPCCSELEGNQPSTHSWNQDPYDQLFSYPQGQMDMDFSQQRFPYDSRREQQRTNRGQRQPHVHNGDGYKEQYGFPGNSTNRGQPGRGVQPDGSMRHRQEQFSLLGYEGYGTIVIQYSFQSGLQGQDHPNPGFRYDGTNRSAYLPDCPEGRKVLKLLREAFDAGLLFTIGSSMTSKLDNQIIWADIPHKTSTNGGPSKYGYPDPTYLSDVKKQLQAALTRR